MLQYGTAASWPDFLKLSLFALLTHVQIFPEVQQENFCSLSPVRRAVHIISSPPADRVFVVSLNMLYWLSKGVTVNEYSPDPALILLKCSTALQQKCGTLLC